MNARNTTTTLARTCGGEHGLTERTNLSAEALLPVEVENISMTKTTWLTRARHLLAPLRWCVLVLAVVAVVWTLEAQAAFAQVGEPSAQTAAVEPAPAPSARPRRARRAKNARALHPAAARTRAASPSERSLSAEALLPVEVENIR